MSDTSGSGFGPFMPGLDLFRGLAGPAASSSASQIPNLSHWVAPTFNVEELDKRIQELKAVHFWLDQNSKALAASIQALEVQKMTLTTLKNMNVSFGEVAEALKMPSVAEAPAAAPAQAMSAPATSPTPFAGLEIPARTYGSAAPAPAPLAGAEAANEAIASASETAPQAQQGAESDPAAAATASAAAVDPLQWWGALAQQFQHIASQALAQAAAAAPAPAASEPAKPVRRAPTRTKSAPKAPAEPSASHRTARSAQAPAAPKARRARAPAGATPPSAATAAPVQPLSPGNWALPTALFPLAGLQAAADAAAASLQPGPAERSVPKKPSSGTGKKAAPARSPTRRKR